MIITIEYRNAPNDDDCKRTDYYTVVDGKEYLLAGDALGGYATDSEIERRAVALFGNSVVIVFGTMNCSFRG